MGSVSGSKPEIPYIGELPWPDRVRPQEVVGVFDSVREEVRVQGRDREQGLGEFGDIIDVAPDNIVAGLVEVSCCTHLSLSCRSAPESSRTNTDLARVVVHGAVRRADSYRGLVTVAIGVRWAVWWASCLRPLYFDSKDDKNHRSKQRCFAQCALRLSQAQSILRALPRVRNIETQHGVYLLF